jgi:hypothetical protein
MRSSTRTMHVVSSITMTAPVPTLLPALRSES